jgi:hypothetical protein
MSYYSHLLFHIHYVTISYSIYVTIINICEKYLSYGQGQTYMEVWGTMDTLVAEPRWWLGAPTILFCFFFLFPCSVAFLLHDMASKFFLFSCSVAPQSIKRKLFLFSSLSHVSFEFSPFLFSCPSQTLLFLMLKG